MGFSDAATPCLWVGNIKAGLQQKEVLQVFSRCVRSLHRSAHCHAVSSGSHMFNLKAAPIAAQSRGGAPPLPEAAAAAAACRRRLLTGCSSIPTSHGSFGAIRRIKLGPAPPSTSATGLAAEVHFASIAQAAAALTAVRC